MGLVRMGVPEALVLFIRKNFNVGIFVETGTFKGETTRWAADHFERVITIELSKELFNRAVQKFQHQHNVDLKFGDSSQELPKIISEIGRSAVFWLDAHHCCSMNTAGKGVMAPILCEIDAITASSHDHFILIDDARLFLAPPPDPHLLNEYPEINVLLKALNERKNHYVVIYDDVIICVPDSAREKISAFCKQETTRNDRIFWAQKLTTERRNSVERTIFRIKNTLVSGVWFLQNKKTILIKWKKYLNDFYTFSSLNNKNERFICRFGDRYPCLKDDTITTPVDRHYVLHPAWAMRVLMQIKPEQHIDIASSLRFVAILSAVIPVEHYDYRPPELMIENLRCGQVDLNRLPFGSGSVNSLSCMHTLEHIGLGRYGDPLDVDGDIKAAEELSRVLAPDGNLLIVVPVGRSRIQFNAHRIYAYQIGRASCRERV